MQLKIIDRKTLVFTESFGISQERAKTLSRGLDNLVMGYGRGVLRMANVFADIAALARRQRS